MLHLVGLRINYNFLYILKENRGTERKVAGNEEDNKYDERIAKKALSVIPIRVPITENCFANTNHEISSLEDLVFVIYTFV